MAEQLAFQQGFGNSRTVDTNIIGRVALAQAVDGARHEFLAGAAFAEHKHGGIGRRHSLNQLPQLLHLGRFADDVLQVISFVRLRAQGYVFLEQAIVFSATRDGVQQFLRRKRFGEVINGTRLDGFHRQLGCGVSGDHQDRQSRPVGARFAQKIETAHAAQAGVGNDHEKILLGQ